MELVEELHVVPQARAGVMESLPASCPAMDVSMSAGTTEFQSNNTSCRRQLGQCGLRSPQDPAGVMQARCRAAGITASSRRQLSHRLKF